MSFSIAYKRLFHVQILHGFYLNRADRLVDFEPANNPAYDLRQILDILPTAATRHWLNGHRARLLPAPTGFSVGIRVEEKEQNGGPAYFPQVPVESGAILTFGLKARLPDWGNFSNLPLRPNLPAIHYFSNLNALGDLTAPFLARPLPTYNDKRAYQMGETVRTNQAVYLAKRTIDTKKNPTGVGGIHWQRLFVFNQQLPHQFHSTEDQLLLPRRFVYRFTPLNNQEIKKGTAVLSTLNDQLVKSIAFDEPHAVEKLALDFSEVAGGFYKLSISSDSGYEHKLSILLDDDLYDPQLFGVLQIGQAPGLGDFRLTEDAGQLRQDSGETVAPVFKLLLKNRHTYWQYVLNQENAPNPAGNADVEFVDPGKKTRLITKQPIPLSRYMAQIYFQHDKPATELDETLLLPNPADLLVHEDEFGRHCSEIFLSKIKV